MPLTLKVVNVLVVLAVNSMVCATVLVLDKVLNVFEPVKVSVEVPVVPPIVRLLYVLPPPAKVLAAVEVSDNTIVDVLGFNVKFVDVAIFQTEPVPDIVHVPEPMFKVLVLELEDEKKPTVTF